LVSATALSAITFLSSVDGVSVDLVLSSAVDSVASAGCGFALSSFFSALELSSAFGTSVYVASVASSPSISINFPFTSYFVFYLTYYF